MANSKAGLQVLQYLEDVPSLVAAQGHVLPLGVAAPREIKGAEMVAFLKEFGSVPQS